MHLNQTKTLLLTFIAVCPSRFFIFFLVLVSKFWSYRLLSDIVELGNASLVVLKVPQQYCLFPGNPNPVTQDNPQSL